MSVPTKNKEKFDKREGVNIKEDMRDYSKEPCFVKKAEEMALLIGKYGLPETFLKKKK